MNITKNDNFKSRFHKKIDLENCQIKKIRKIYYLVDSEEIVSFIDDSILSNFNSGILFTNRGIHWKLIMNKGFIRYCDISELSYKEIKSHTTILINDNSLEMLAAEFSENQISSYIDECLKNYGEESKSLPSEHLKENIKKEYKRKEENKRKKKVNIHKVSVISRILIIELPYFLFLLGVILYNVKTPFLQNKYIETIIFCSVALFVLSIPYRIVKAIARFRTGDPIIVSIIIHLIVFIFKIIFSAAISTICSSNSKSISSTRNSQVKKYLCQWCGSEYSSLGRLTSDNCHKNPYSGKHQPYKGSIKSKYQCEYCGQSFESIGSSSRFTCHKSPTGKHHIM